MTAARHKASAPGIVLTLVFFCVNSAAFSQTPVTRSVAYVIDVSLNPRLHTIEGTEMLTWHNTSDQSVSSLEFHMYTNAFRSNRTTLLSETGGSISRQGRGWIDIIGMTDLRTEQNLTERSEYIQPDDQNPYDSTVLAVKLSEPVGPRDSIELGIRFREQLPEAISGTGWAPGEEYYFVSHWFPKIGVYQNGAWDCHQFSASSDFFSAFGNYDVKISVPVRYIVGATGARSGDEMNSEGMMTYRYVADSVQDFVWTASPDFSMRSRSFKYPGLPKTRVILLLQPQHVAQTEEYFEAIGHAIEYFGLKYGPYQYPDITIVDPPWNMGPGRTSAANEYPFANVYPALITAHTDLYELGHSLNAEEAIICGFGSQYWEETIAGKDTAGQWLGRGLSAYSAGESLEHAYGPKVSVYKFAGAYPVYAYPVWEVAGFPVAALIGKVWIYQPYGCLPLYLRYANSDAMAVEGYNASYGDNADLACGKPTLVMATLEGVLGKGVMERVLRTYYQQFRFRHPTLQDFQKVCQEVSGRNLDWFFNQLVRGTGTVDFSVESISYYRKTDLNSGASTFVTKVVVRRRGEVKMPVGLRLALEDGGAVDTVWNGEDREQVFRFETIAAPYSAEVDPFQKIPLDVNYSNNSLTVDENLLPVLKWVNRVFVYFQNILLNIGAAV